MPKIFAPFFLLVATLIVGFIYQFNRYELQDIRSRAETPICAEQCVNPPPCCAKIAETGDAFACAWDEGRGWCPPDVCSKIQGKGQRCGWYWIWHDKDASPNKDLGTNTPNGYGCMIGDSEATMRPVCGNQQTQPSIVPTTPPLPTQIVVLPTVEPTPTEIILPPTNPPPPTQIIEEPTRPPRPQITYVPIVIPPYTPPTATPTPTPFKFTLPNILPPKEKVQTFLEKVRLNLFDFFSKILP